MKPYIVAIIALLASLSFASAQDTTISITLTPAQAVGLVHVTQTHNAQAQAAHDAIEATKPVGQRVAYVPITTSEYAQLRLSELFASYRQARIESLKATDNYKAYAEKLATVRAASRASVQAAIDAGQ